MFNFTIKHKIVLLMGAVVTITPTLLVALLASVYYYLGIESFFNEKVSSAISETVKISRLYLEEHKKNINADILSVANAIELNYSILSRDPNLLQILLDRQSYLRNLSEIIVFTKDGVIDHTSLSFTLFFETPLDVLKEHLQKLNEGEVVIIKTDKDDKVRAIVKLNSFFDDTYLLVGRYIDPEIINHLKQTQGSADEYKILWGDIKLTRAKLEAAFIVLSALLCFSAILIANKLSNLIARPLKELVDATAIIKSGDFSIRVPERKANDEIAILARAFNRMTERIAHQRDELIQANELMDTRRRFIEVVLAELSAGILAINPSGYITLYNNSADQVLKFSYFTNSDLHYSQIFPEIGELVEVSLKQQHKHIDRHIVISREQQNIHLFVKIATITNAKHLVESIIVTFNDITELVSAQRSTAWADIARRIAHEIKNPLTPIHLAAERLKKKYINQIIQDTDTFNRYIDTIIRHVTDIEQMVGDFIEFARIPAPKFSRYNLCQIIQDVILLQQATYSFITYNFNSDKDTCYIECDRGQISQIFVNILKNAAESITIKYDESKHEFHGIININITVNDSNNLVDIKVNDNGKGIEADLIQRIMEPYITTKQKGTGLGLPIVKKLIEDHGGKLNIFNTQTGVCAAFNFKITNSNLQS